MLRRYLPVWFVSVFGLCAVAAMTVTPSPGATQVALVMPPWQSETQRWRTVAALDVPIVRHGFNSRIVIVDISANPTIRSRLQDASLFLMDPAMAGACLALAARPMTARPEGAPS